MEIRDLVKGNNKYDILKDPLVEYIIEFSNKHYPSYDFDENGEPYQIDSFMYTEFCRRYFYNKIDSDFRSKFLEDIHIKRTLEDLELDVSKFYYLLLFIRDYTLTTIDKSYTTEYSGKDELIRFCNKITEHINEKGYSQTIIPTTHPDITISLSIKGKKGVDITNSSAIYYLHSLIAKGIDGIEIGSPLTDKIFNTKDKVDVSKTTTYFIFVDLIKKFLSDKKYPKYARLGKMTFIARLMYVSGVTDEDRYNDISTSGKLLSDMIKRCEKPDIWNMEYNTKI